MKLSIIIPLYNEKNTIQELLRRVTSASLPKGMQREIIIVDDGSTDGGFGDKEKVLFPDVLFLKHAKNKGKGAAIRTAIEQLTGDVIIIQDADLEYYPEDYPLILEPMKTGIARVCYGSRFMYRYIEKVYTSFKNPYK